MNELSLDEFGQDLFEAIKLQAGIKQAQRNLLIYERKRLKRAANNTNGDIKRMSAALQVILQKNTIAPADLKRLLAIQ